MSQAASCKDRGQIDKDSGKDPQSFGDLAENGLHRRMVGRNIEHVGVGLGPGGCIDRKGGGAAGKKEGKLLSPAGTAPVRLPEPVPAPALRCGSSEAAYRSPGLYRFPSSPSPDIFRFRHHSRRYSALHSPFCPPARCWSGRHPFRSQSSLRLEAGSARPHTFLSVP